MGNIYDFAVREHRGFTFDVEWHHDTDHGPPWEEHDGHGVVTDWLTTEDVQLYAEEQQATDMRPLTHWDGNRRRWYDVAASIRRAIADKWGLNDEELAKLRAETSPREPSAEEIMHRAVIRDYEYLRSWAQDEWHYCGIVVRLRGVGGIVEQSLWGFESNVSSWYAVITELADEIIRTGAPEIQKEIKRLQATRRLLLKAKATRGRP